MEINNVINANIHNDFFNNEIIISKKYDYAKKMELVKKINKIKKKKYLLDIFKIILLYSKNYTENNNGVFVFFHNLDDEVYEKIELYVNDIYKLHQRNNVDLTAKSFITSIQSDNSDIIIDGSDTFDLNTSADYNNEKGLSNKEKIIMKRKKYEKYINQNQEN
jgi:hypothetical protein